MRDLIEEGRKLWYPPPADMAEAAEKRQLHGSGVAEKWRTDGGNQASSLTEQESVLRHPPSIRQSSATIGAHGYGKSATSATSATPPPASELERIIEVLVGEVCRNLGPELITQMYQTLLPLSRQARAELATAIDDVFQTAQDVSTARQRAMEILTNENALIAVKAVWPGYPGGSCD